MRRAAQEAQGSGVPRTRNERETDGTLHPGDLPVAAARPSWGAPLVRGIAAEGPHEADEHIVVQRVHCTTQFSLM
eukprot:6391031-Prymnesium_polylepis.1